MSVIYAKCAFSFFIAFGVVMGGALLAGVGAVFVWTPPKIEMLKVAANLKIWALVAAVGGSIDPIRVIETNVTQGHISIAFIQIAYILFAFLGAHLGTELIQWMCVSGE